MGHTHTRTHINKLHTHKHAHTRVNIHSFADSMAGFTLQVLMAVVICCLFPLFLCFLLTSTLKKSDPLSDNDIKTGLNFA